MCNKIRAFSVLIFIFNSFINYLESWMSSDIAKVGLEDDSKTLQVKFEADIEKPPKDLSKLGEWVTNNRGYDGDNYLAFLQRAQGATLIFTTTISDRVVSQLNLPIDPCISAFCSR